MWSGIKDICIMRESNMAFEIQENVLSSEDQDFFQSDESESCRQSSSSCSSFSLKECLDELKARNISSNFQQDEDDNEDLINQNLSNKQNERMSKPCRNGACYCFTSDTDEVRMSSHRNSSDIRRKSKIKKVSEVPYGYEKNTTTKVANNRTFKAISTLKEVGDSDAPLVHIIQEIRKHCVISEVRVRKHPRVSRIQNRKPEDKLKKRYRKSLPEVKGDIYNSCRANISQESNNASKNKAEIYEGICNTENFRRGGRLLEKRLSVSGQSGKWNESQSAPRKPPRTFAKSINLDSSSTASSLRNAEQILNEFLNSRGHFIDEPTKYKKNLRKSYPLQKDTKTITNNFIKKSTILDKPAPSCPSLSDIIGLMGEDNSSHIEWQSKGISEMLNYDQYKDEQQFKTTKATAEAQKIGWTIPKSLDIDTVDGVDIRNHQNSIADFNNLVENIEAKATPIKAEIFQPNTKLLLKNQLKNIVSSSPWKKVNTKSSKSENVLKTTSHFLNSSKTKLKKLVFKKPAKSNPVMLQTIGSQTQASDFDSSERIQSPPGSYFSKITTDFDFKRKIDPPKKERLQRELTFSPKSVNRKHQIHEQSYRSYADDLDRDLTLIKMSSILNGIKARLEASDELAIRTFREIERRDQAFAENSSNGVNVLSSTRRSSAEVEISNADDPIYSEIEEDSIFITENASIHNLTQVQHFIAGNNPEAIYAQVNKTPKKSELFNNLLERHSPPKCSKANKSNLSHDSAIFFDNLSRSKSIEYLGKVKNIDLEDVYAPLASVETFVDFGREGFSDSVSYESPNATNMLDIDISQGNIQQSTPKKSTFVSKSTDIEMESTRAYDTVDAMSLNAFPTYDERSEIIANGYLKNKPIKSSLLNYKTFKNKIRKSFRKSKDYIQHESKRFSFNAANNNTNMMWEQSTLCLSKLYALESATSVHDQLEKAVCLCRLLPDLENSSEMAEAERLLLYSSLKEGVMSKVNSSEKLYTEKSAAASISVHDFEIPVRDNVNEDQFFKYYYTGVFYNGITIQSTESTECKNNKVIFSNCNIMMNTSGSVIKCDVYMLRLRKISPTALQRIKESSSNSILSENLNSAEELESRFRLQGCFTIQLSDFHSFKCKNTDISEGGLLKLHSNEPCKVTFNSVSKNTNLLDEVTIRSNAEFVLSIPRVEGFLNLEDCNIRHNWNRQWCVLDNLILRAWDYPQDVQLKTATLTVNLYDSNSLYVAFANRSQCAKSKAFYIYTSIGKKIMFAADNQVDLDYWTSGINTSFDVIRKWMRHVS